MSRCGHRLCHGLHGATTDLDLVDSWWRTFPRGNIGARPLPGDTVLDIDPRNGGDRALDRLQTEHFELPPTLTARTGGGGLHIHLGCHGVTKGKLCQGIDIKTHSTGYIVWPGSIHPTGRRYHWLHEVPIAPAPPWLVDLLRLPRPREFDRSTADPSRRAQGLLNYVLGATPETDRNSRLYWACKKAIEGGLDLEPLIDAAVHLGLTRTEAVRTAQSAAKRAAA
jgi:hypothetical protein